MDRPPFLAALGALGLGAACSDPLPSSRVVIDARVLAIRVEVTQSLTPLDDVDKAPRVQALPLETVQITPFVVGPDGPYGRQSVSDRDGRASDLVPSRD